MIEKLYDYISHRFIDGVLISEDELYTAFETEFYNGIYPESAIDEHIQIFAQGYDLTGIKIEYEGEIDGISNRGINTNAQLPYQATRGIETKNTA